MTTLCISALGHVQREVVERFVRDWHGGAFAATWSPPSLGNRFNLFVEEDDLALVHDLVVEAADRLGATVRDAYDPTTASHWRALESVARRIERLFRDVPCMETERLLAAIGPNGNTIEHLARAWGRTQHLTESMLATPYLMPLVERRADGRWHRRAA